jgi:hypothetical protein
MARNNARPSHYLHVLGYRAWNGGKKVRVNGERTKLYVNPRLVVQGLDDAAEILEARIEKI